MQVSDIPTKNWQLDLNNAGKIVAGYDDIQQCIAIILRTRKGEDPLRPDFGSDIWKWLDKPISASIPNMKREIIQALQSYEPRITIQKIVHEMDITEGKSNIIFGITYKTGENYTGTFQYHLKQDTRPLALSASYLPDAFLYFIEMSLQGGEVTPASPQNGFLSINEMMKWVHQFWGNLGNWYLLIQENKVIVYINTQLGASGKLTVTSVTSELHAPFPERYDLINYNIIFKKDGRRIAPWNSEGFQTENEALNFVSQQYKDYGKWILKDNYLVLIASEPLDGCTLEINLLTKGAFSSDFNEDFEI
ncbi:phage baseplate assembly protein W [Chryseobacterium sp. 7]|uniref:GPW/gp25 family protein n=1 Tax=Chryseobacterium sp. 7 TaxID=2035214 RepID=UPI000EB1D256|nr:GPW/gp25 family protein [Chryseobacterium sp. 7]RLJ34178.1 phage baseplate assembly protein W [Chryseobacterium sp. 7]